MFLYNLTLQRATGISFAIHGNFSGNCLLPSRFLGRRGEKGIGFLLVSFFIGLLKLCCFGGAFFFLLMYYCYLLLIYNFWEDQKSMVSLPVDLI